MGDKIVVFLCCAYSQDKKDKYLLNSKRGYQFAAQNFQEAIIDGLIQNEVSPKILSIPSLSTFPFGYKLPIVRKTDFIFAGESFGKSMGFLNIPFLNCPLLIKSNKELGKIINDDNDPLIFVYGLHKKLIKIALKYKDRHRGTKIIYVVPDLPEFMAYNKYYKKLGLYDRDIKYIYSKISLADGLVVLTKEMLTKLNCKDIPNVVVEGIYKDDCNSSQSQDGNVNILYAGGLSERYGTMDLIEAFHRINNNNFRLWICGRGECEGKIVEYSKKDKRILFYGAVSKEQVVRLQSSATILVNPRHSGEEFTKYSFPSKTLEYMGSGTPTLMCKLSCVPDEYYPFLFFFEDESIEGMSKRIEEICLLPQEVLNKKGEDARHFVLKNKNSKEQVKKMLNLARQL